MKKLSWLLAIPLAATSALALKLPTALVDVIRTLTIDIPALAQTGADGYTMFIRVVLFFLVYAIIQFGVKQILPADQKGARIAISVALSLLSTILVPAEILTAITSAYSTIIVLIAVLLPAILAVALWKHITGDTYATRFIRGAILLILAYLYMWFAEIFVTKPSGALPQTLLVELSGWMGIGALTAFIFAIIYLIPLGTGFGGWLQRTPGTGGGTALTPGAGAQTAQEAAQAAAAAQSVTPQAVSAADALLQQVKNEIEQARNLGGVIQAFTQAVSMLDNKQTAQAAAKALPGLVQEMQKELQEFTKGIMTVRANLQQLQEPVNQLNTLTDALISDISKIPASPEKTRIEHQHAGLNAKTKSISADIQEEIKLATDDVSIIRNMSSKIAEAINKLNKWKNTEAKEVLKKVPADLRAITDRLQRIQQRSQEIDKAIRTVEAKDLIPLRVSLDQLLQQHGITP